MNIDRLIDFMIERDDADFDYTVSSKRYYKKHGHGVNLDRAKTHEECHIEYAYHALERAHDTVYGIFEVLGLDTEQRERAYAAGRFMKRWYESTKWERLPSHETLERVWDYIKG